MAVKEPISPAAEAIANEVEDAADVKLNLEETGAYEVRAENMGRFGLAAVRQFKPDLILLDIIMPDMSGGEVAFQIGDDRIVMNTQIVFLTAAAKKADEGLIADLTIIAKPVDPEQVIDWIEKNL